MNLLLALAFLFFIGSVIGWVLELLFRRFLSSANPERKWINPGFCTGPYLPLYGSGLCVLFLLAQLEQRQWISDPVWNRVLLFAIMAMSMTIIEYLSGLLALKVARLRLWDYSTQWGNIQGLICPKFSLIWALLGAAYYFLIHPHILEALTWLSRNLAFSFFIGLFFGVFTIDAAHSIQLTAKLKRFADENQIIVRYESLKQSIRTHQEQAREKYRFFAPFRSELPLRQHLKLWKEELEQRARR